MFNLNEDNRQLNCTMQQLQSGSLFAVPCNSARWKLKKIIRVKGETTIIDYYLKTNLKKIVIDLSKVIFLNLKSKINLKGILVAFRLLAIRPKRKVLQPTLPDQCVLIFPKIPSRL
uniref:Uncharacterized protein n=1 Tax=Cacopsylla melanoneura TaxID=428564 RepID=A0A8D8LDZ5_9HEMI